MFDELFKTGDTYFAIIVAFLMFYPFIFVDWKIEEGDRKYSKTFLNTWKGIIFVMWFFAVLNGSPKRIAIAWEIEPFIAVGEFLGVWLGLYFISWVLTYIFLFMYKTLKPLAKKIHDISNED